MKSLFYRHSPAAPAGLVLLLAGILAGCATPTAVVHKVPALSEPRPAGPARAPARTAKPGLPPALTTAPMESVAVKPVSAERALPTEVVRNLELADEADVAMILRTLAKAAQVNMLVSPQVGGKISFTFKDVPWDQAFRSVIVSAGLTYAWDGDVLRVMTIDDMKRNLEMETILKDREDVEKIVALVEQLDRAKAQVHIEARIVEATRDTARQLGVQWGASAARVDNGRLLAAGGKGVTVGGYNSDFPAQFAQAAVSPVGMTFGLISKEIGGSELLSMQLTALQQKGRIQILSSPSITTLDNEAALIESGEERAYRVTTGTGNILDTSLEWKKAVLKLEVTPHVVDGEYLRVEILANKDSFDETKPQLNNEYPVNTKHASTTVLLRNGETVVIGGLSLEGESHTDSGIPFLMDIPVIGALFKNEGDNKKFDETLIFITPKIIASRP